MEPLHVSTHSVTSSTPGWPGHHTCLAVCCVALGVPLRLSFSAQRLIAPSSEANAFLPNLVSKASKQRSSMRARLLHHPTRCVCVFHCARTAGRARQRLRTAAERQAQQRRTMRTPKCSDRRPLFVSLSPFDHSASPRGAPPFSCSVAFRAARRVRHYSAGFRSTPLHYCPFVQHSSDLARINHRGKRNSRGRSH